VHDVVCEMSLNDVNYEHNQMFRISFPAEILNVTSK
jgi:hypothetical protein